MPGLSLGAGAQVRTGGNYGFSSQSPQPTTATAAAFGPSSAPAPMSSNLSPANAGGLAFWVGVAGVALLVGIYYSLPG